MTPLSDEAFQKLLEQPRWTRRAEWLSILVARASFAYGVALLDNALLEPLAKACVDENRDEFMLVIAPLKVVGGTGSPANPLAIF